MGPTLNHRLRALFVRALTGQYIATQKVVDINRQDGRD